MFRGQGCWNIFSIRFCVASILEYFSPFSVPSSVFNQNLINRHFTYYNPFLFNTSESSREYVFVDHFILLMRWTNTLLFKTSSLVQHEKGREMTDWYCAARSYLVLDIPRGERTILAAMTIKDCSCPVVGKTRSLTKTRWLIQILYYLFRKRCAGMY